MGKDEFTTLSAITFIIFGPLGGLALDNGMPASAASLWGVSLFALLCALVMSE